MKDLIKQILREETSGLDPKVISAAYKMMNNLTKGCHWYFDTPKQRFEYTPESIWLINPETKEWLLEFDKSGKLRYYYEIYPTFKNYFNMKLSDFQSFIKLWVEDALKRGVSTTSWQDGSRQYRVEDALKRGVSTTLPAGYQDGVKVEDALKRGVSTTASSYNAQRYEVEDALKRGVSTTHPVMGVIPKMVDDILKKGKELR